MINPRERINRFLSLRDESGKFTKAEAYYVNSNTLKSFRCSNCNHYDPEERQCDLVEESGPPGSGRISPQGSCALYNARPPRIQYIQNLWGRNKMEGVAPERARATAFMFTYAALDETPPKELRDKALITVDQAKRFIPRRSSVGIHEEIELSDPNDEEY